MKTDTDIVPAIDAPDLSVTAKLILNKLLGYENRTGKVVVINGKGLNSKTATMAYQQAIAFMQRYRLQAENAGAAYKAWVNNEVRFKFK